MKKYFFIFIILIAALFLYGRYIEPHTIKIKEYTISNSNIPESFNGLKIIHFSDLLYKEDTTEDDLKKIVAKINQYKPDVIFFTGDLIYQNYQISEDDKNLLIKYLNKMDCSLYKYAVIGDNDEINDNQYYDILDKSNFKLLNNNKEYLFYKDINPIKIIGLTNTMNISELLIEEENITPIYTIVLTHEPGNINELKDYNFDLILAGHYLGGIINIPFYGALIKKDHTDNYLNNYYKINNTEVYISNGIGTEYFSFRLFNKPSINFYRLNKN